MATDVDVHPSAITTTSPPSSSKGAVNVNGFKDTFATRSPPGELDRVLSSLVPPPPDEVVSCLRNLAAFTVNPRPQPYPTQKLAGVLILLSISRETGDLQVTLTTRSRKLRSHPGDTALPGGRHDATDASIEGTALREANEEIALPLGLVEARVLVHLATLAAFTSATMLCVIPSVYFLADARVLERLEPNPDEVDAIFHVPLRSFLGLSDPYSNANDGSGIVYTYEDLPWVRDALYRLHRFNHTSFPSDISGLTADILISTALIASYGLDEAGEEAEEGEGKLGFVRRAKGQLKWREIVEVAIVTDKRWGAREAAGRKKS